MATRMQQRRGTAAQWTGANPILAVGEIGFETDTGKFKIGDGTNHWDDLSYFQNMDDLGGSFDDYIPLTQKGQANGVAQLDATGNVPFSQLGNIIDGAPGVLDTLNEIAAAINDDPTFFTSVATNLSNHEADTTNVHGIGNTADLATKTYADNAVTDHNTHTGVHGVFGTLVGTSDTQTLTNKTITSADNSLTIDLSDISGITASAAEINKLDGVTATTEELNILDGVTVSAADINKLNGMTATTAELNILDGAIVSAEELNVLNGITVTTNDLNNLSGLTSNVQDQLNAKASLSGATFTGSVEIDQNLIVDGDLTVNGTTFTASASSIVIEDNMVQLAHQNAGNTVDLGLVVGYNDGSLKHSGVVRDVSADRWKIFKGVTTEPSTTVDFTQGSLDDLQVAGFWANSAIIGDVTNTEIQYLSGVTSAIQTQINDKISASSTDTLTNKTISATNNTLSIATTDLTGVTASAAEVNILDGATISTSELNILDGVVASASEINILSGATLSTTELNYVDGVTSSIQTQINSKADSSDLTSHTSATTAHGVSGTLVGTSDAQTLTNKVISAASNTITIAPTDLTGVTATASELNILDGATLSTEELNYVDGVTSSIQTQLDSKAPTASPTFTGTVSGITKSMVGLGNVDNTSDADKPVSTATQSALDLKAPLASPTFTGTVTLPSTTSVGDVSSTELGYVNGVTSAIQTQIDGKASLSGATFTGSVGIGQNLTVDGNLTVNGTTFNASSTSIVIEDNLVQLAHQNAANTVDLGVVVGYNDGSAKHAGIVRDVSADKWKLFKGVTTEPTTTVDFTQGSLDDLEVAGFVASSASIGDVSNTELQYLNGVTSAIQTQIDSKAPLSSPTFTGTVTVPTLTLTNALSAINGGTGQSTYAAGDILYASATNTLSKLAKGTDGQILTLSSGLPAWAPAPAGYLAPTLGSTSIASGATVTTIAGLTLTTATLTTPTLTLSSTTSTTSGRIAFDATTDKIVVGDGTSAIEFAPSTILTNAQTASYTLVLADKDKLVEVSNASANTLTIPLNSSAAFPVGSQIVVLQTGAGQTTIAGAAGVTVNGTPGLKLRAQWSSATLIKRATDTWVAIGDLVA